MVALVSLSIVIALFLIWLIYFKGKVAAPDWVGALPAANASFNSLSALCLTFGYINIRAEIVLYINDHVDWQQHFRRCP